MQDIVHHTAPCNVFTVTQGCAALRGWVRSHGLSHGVCAGPRAWNMGAALPLKFELARWHGAGKVGRATEPLLRIRATFPGSPPCHDVFRITAAALTSVTRGTASKSFTVLYVSTSSTSPPSQACDRCLGQTYLQVLFGHRHAQPLRRVQHMTRYTHNTRTARTTAPRTPAVHQGLRWCAELAAASSITFAQGPSQRYITCTRRVHGGKHITGSPTPYLHAMTAARRCDAGPFRPIAHRRVPRRHSGPLHMRSDLSMRSPLLRVLVVYVHQSRLQASRSLAPHFTPSVSCCPASTSIHCSRLTGSLCHTPVPTAPRARLNPPPQSQPTSYPTPQPRPPISRPPLPQESYVAMVCPSGVDTVRLLPASREASRWSSNSPLSRRWI